MYLIKPRCGNGGAPPLSHWLRPNEWRTLCNKAVTDGWHIIQVDDAPVICSRCQRIARDKAQWAAGDVTPATTEGVAAS